MLEDSVAHYAPGQTLESAACMAVLRGPLKFRDAFVGHYPPGMGRPDAPPFLSIRVVEPGRVEAWRAMPRDAYPSLLPEYAPLILPATDSTGGIWPSRLLQGMYMPDSLTRIRMFPHLEPAEREDYERTIAFLGTHRRERDRQLALHVLDSSSAYGNRMTAALVLSNFPEADQSWYALVRALRDPHEAVREAAAAAVARMPKRRVDWAPVAGELRALLGGTNLSHMDAVLVLLAQTEVSSTLVGPLLRGNDQWILRLLTAEAPMAAPHAKALLVALHGGTDLGNTPAPWRAWIATR
jgi:hypothetical protein